MLGCAVTAEGFIEVNQRLETTRPHTFAVGELTGIGGVDKAVLEGRMAALAASGNDPAPLMRRHAQALSFAHRLKKAFSLRPELFTLAQPDTIVCRCEDVPLSVAAQCLSSRDAKLQTRCGMGPCQGRVCGPVLERLIRAESPVVRPPLFPTNIATLTRHSPK
jgi:NADPH-dependent 2,4-dienoyl-CoA reductase/sulfur reductase-like enzyme